MKAAHNLIDDTFDKHGPFDGVFGFSTGAGLLISYLLEKATLYPLRPLPVQFAIFCSPMPPLSADPAYTKMIHGSLSPEDQQRIRSGEDAEICRLPEPIRSSISLTARCFDILKPVHGRPRSDFLCRDILEVPCVLQPDVYRTRLNIPTLHCWSNNDPPMFAEAAKMVESFCNPRLRVSYQHSAIHNLPRSTVEVKEMVSAMGIMLSQNEQARL
ncbi:hypothetical protein N7466_009342 [Penicillium verhagenii]|uniref:uncharacterized protein n=1 Tax=Penicillium verhagenii TaxID=1562060 RepID=UPI002545A985|nr:uncharacterized protein N7466_009342 [Penicillium verhagenii]KAJ5921016.1 hypothetical protein N7466_009342 [Penicillium verhagenii]